MKMKKIVKIVNLYILRILKGGKNAFGYKKLGVGSIICHPMRIIGKKYISIGKGCYILDGLRMEAVSCWGKDNYNPNISLADDVRIQQNCHITCANKISIGKGTSILPNVLITDITHVKEVGKSLDQTGLTIGSIHIGENCIIGMGARIMANGKDLFIGNDVVIGANAVVTKSIEDATIAVGIPAQMIKKV